MAIFIHCPACNKHLDTMASDCPHCGAELPPGVLYALSAALGDTSSSVQMTTPGRLPPHLTQSMPHVSAPPPQDMPPGQNSTLRPWLAAALSLLCGLGQLYNGQIVKGLVLIALGAAAIVSWNLSLGKFLLPIVWLYAILDAYFVARRADSGRISGGRRDGS